MPTDEEVGSRRDVDDGLDADAEGPSGSSSPGPFDWGLSSGRPVAIIKGPHAASDAASGSACHDDGQEALISISHDGDYATAVCLAWAGHGEGGIVG